MRLPTLMDGVNSVMGVLLPWGADFDPIARNFTTPRSPSGAIFELPSSIVSTGYWPTPDSAMLQRNHIVFLRDHFQRRLYFHKTPPRSYYQ